VTRLHSSAQHPVNDLLSREFNKLPPYEEGDP